MKKILLLVVLAFPTHVFAENSSYLKTLFTAIQESDGLIHDKYETTKEYNKRQCQVFFKKMELTDTSSLTFKDIGVIDYNPDKQRYQLELPTIDLDGDAIGATTFNSWENIELKKQEQKGGSYIGSNSFGASKEVNRSFFQFLSIYVNGLTVIRPQASFKFKREDAKILGNDIAFSFSVHLNSPCINHKKMYIRPNADNPIEQTIDVYQLVAKEKIEWTAYQKSSGKLIKKGFFKIER